MTCIIIFKQFIGQTSDKLHGHNSYMQVIFSLIHIKQDSISLAMNKQSLAGLQCNDTKKIICVHTSLLPPYHNIVTPSPDQTKPTYGI